MSKPATKADLRAVVELIETVAAVIPDEHMQPEPEGAGIVHTIDVFVERLTKVKKQLEEEE